MMALMSTRMLGRGALLLLLGGTVAGCSHHHDRERWAYVPPARGYWPAQVRPNGSTPYQPSSPVVTQVVPPRPTIAPAGLQQSLDGLAAGFGGRVGIAVRSVDNGWAVASNGDTPMPQQSVSKLWVTMTVLDLRDQGHLALTDPVTVTRNDLTLFHQPIAALVRTGDYHTTVGELIQRAMTMSDNTANDILLRLAGGPTAVRAFLLRKGISNVRFGPGERMLQSETAGLTWRPEYAFGDAFSRARARLPQTERVAAFERYVANPPDGAAPAAIAAALARLSRGELLSETSTRYLMTTMQSSHTGLQRMRGAVPPGWQFGHKTGTGQNLGGRTAGYNDVGFLVAPDGRRYTVAVMIGDTPRSIPERQQLMHSVVGAVVGNDAGRAAPGSQSARDANLYGASQPGLSNYGSYARPQQPSGGESDD